jgi:hypothetical protein
MFEHVAKYLQPAFEREIKNSPTGPYRDMTVSKMENIINRYIRQSERYRAMKAGGHSHEEIMAAFDIPVDMKVFQYGSTYDTPQEVDVRMSPRDSIIYYKKFLRADVCAIDPENGQVKAYVPGLNFEYFMYDNVLGGGHRQVGSTIKPLLYALAMSSQNLTPCDEVNANPQDYGGWTPKGDSLGMVPLKLALAQSNNHASAYLLSLIKPETFIDFLGNKLKMSTYTMEPNLTLALGSCDVSVGEMASAYTIFPSYGVHYQPLLVTHIENSEGDIVASFTPRMNEVLSKEKAYPCRAEGANVWVVNPDETVGQSLAGYGDLEMVQSKPDGVIYTLDLTSAYANQVESALRGYMLSNNRKVFTVQDEIKPITGSNDFYWFWHTRADIDINQAEKKATLTMDGETVTLYFDSNVDFTISKQDKLTSLPNSPVVDGQLQKPYAQAMHKIVIEFASNGEPVTFRAVAVPNGQIYTKGELMPVSEWAIPVE